MTVPYTKSNGAQHARPPKDGRDGVPPSAAGNMPTLHGQSVGNMPPLPQRKRPAHGVLISFDVPTIVFLTVCTNHREPWLACEPVHKALMDVWKEADAWSLGFYLLMPDHLHLFCSPHKMEFTLKAWVSHWKRKFSCLHVPDAGSWQRDYWDTRLRRAENYHDKWEYVRQNPVRKGLVARSDDWPYQGVMNELRW